MKPTKHLLIFVFTVMTLIALQAPFNWYFDPYNAFLHKKTQGINAPTREFSRRITPFYQSEHLNGSGLILGSSRALSIDSWRYFSADKNVHWNNLWINMANINEIRRLLQQAVAFNEINIVILGLDFEGFNANNIRTDFFTKATPALTQEGKFNPLHVFSQLELLFSPTTTKASMQVLLDNLRITSKLENLNTQKISTQEKQETRESFRKNTVTTNNTVVGGFSFEDTTRSVSTFEDLRAIIQTCQTKNVKLLLFTNPEHAETLESFHKLGCWASYQEWLRKIARIVADQNMKNPLNSIELWNFAGYSTINTSYIGPDTKWGNNFFSDPSHFNPTVGDFILDKITGQRLAAIPAPQDFGIILTPDNVEEVLHLMDINRSLYLEAAKNWN
ncbi:MAG: hypothetical protein FD177_1723 [Desulfovibrionaceae bacterium]|nr:MAG: hypothetical protein FD177_1723 [Desulfovibrionaceae bacterium]